MADESLLVIDDDLELCELLADFLGREGFEVRACHDGEAGLAALAEAPPSLVVLDVMLPGDDGFEVLRKLRARSAVPVVMLTARGDDVDRIVGLENGADDYLAKPFNPRELVARIRAIQRRVAPPPALLEAGPVSLDLDAREARVRGVRVELTAAELGLLELLMRSAGQVVSRDELAERVLGRSLSPFDRSVDVHMSNLRKKLSVGADSIKTIRGAGYLMAKR